MKFKFLLWALLIFSGSCQSQTAPKLQRDKPLPLDPAVRYGKLENGFTYYLRKTNSPENDVRFDLVVKAGRDHEDQDQREYAHLLEHLVYKETQNFPNARLHFQQGGRGYHAFTENRSTKYFTTIPKDDKEVFKDGLLILQDLAQGNSWEAKSIAVERAAIEGESKTKDPYKVWRRHIAEKEILNEMRYSAFDLRASLSSLRNFNSEAFYRFYHDWYRPGLQAAIIVGDINVDSLERVIKNRFETLKGPPYPPDAVKYLEAQTVHFDDKVHFSTIHDSVEPKIQVEIMRTRPNLELNPRSRRDYHDMLLQQLYMILLDKRAYNIRNQYDPPFAYFWANYASGLMAGGQINATQMRLDLGVNDPNILKSQFQKGIKSWKQLHLKIDQTEFKEAKQDLMAKYRKPQLNHEFSERLQNHFVDGRAFPNPDFEAKLIIDLLNEISLEELKIFIKEKGSLKKNTHFLFFKGENIEMPPYEVFKKWIKEVDTMQLEPFKAPAPPIQTLEDVVEIPTSLTMNDIEVEKNLIGVTTVQLPNGIKLVLKPTPPAMDYLKNTISLRAFRPNVVPLDNQEEYLAAQAATEVMAFSGAGPYSKFELERFMRDKQMNLRFKLDREHQFIEATAKGEELQELLNLIYLYLEKPRYDQLAFEAWKNNKADDLQGKGRKGSSAFIMEKIKPQWYPQVPVMELKNLEKLQPKQVFQAKQKWFSSIENYTFIVTGDFYTATLLPVLVKKLSGFPVREEQLIASSKLMEFPIRKLRKNFRFKNIDAAYVSLYFPIKVKRNLKTEVELQLLSKALSQRIWNKLREGSYAPVVSGEWLDSKKGVFAFKINFDGTPGAQDKMTSWALEEFRNLKENGVNEEWLKTAIAEESRMYESSFSTFDIFDFWQEYLQSRLENGEDLEDDVLRYSTILKYFISLENLNLRAKEFMTEDNLQIFLGLPYNYSNVK